MQPRRSEPEQVTHLTWLECMERIRTIRRDKQRARTPSKMIPAIPCSLTFLAAASSLLLLLQTLVTFSDALSQSLPPPERLRRLLNAELDGTSQTDHPILLPCCYDGLTARLIARAGFGATFMTGFGVSAARGYPDTQLVSYREMLDSCSMVSEALAGAALELGTDPLPCIADGDTGYGNAMNCKRTVHGYGRAGMGGIMIEDQVSPKRCGHVGGKSVISFDEAVMRVKAACDARDEYESLNGKGTGPLVLARTDSLVTDGFEDAIQRCLAFREAGCDMTFLEAPQTVEQMKEYCDRVSGPKLANMLEYGTTPVLPPKELKAIGYTLAAYPLTLLSASIRAMNESLELIKNGKPTDDMILSFGETKDAVGFTRYGAQEDKYKA